MEILTKSIQSFLVDAFDKDIEQIGYGDLLLVEGLTINGKDYNQQRQLVSFNEIKLFKNLKYLELCNVVISNYMITILSEMSYLENIIFRNCTFRKSIVTLNNLKPLKQIRIEHCKNFRLEYINNLVVDYLTISKCPIKNFSSLKNTKLCVLDISRAMVDNLYYLNDLDIRKLIISHDVYKSYSDMLTGLNIDLVVMARDGFYIESVISNCIS